MNFDIEDIDLGFIWGKLHNELIGIGKQIEQEEDRSELKRNYITTFFSIVESISYSTRQILLLYNKYNQIELSSEEIYLLKEKSIEIKSNGTIRTKERYFAFESLFKFTYLTYSKHFNKGSLYKDLINDNRYNSFKDALEIRNRITHPKDPQSIIISKVEFDKICEAHDWYHNFLIEILEGDVLKKETPKD
jgi:hypothetical protein